MDGFFAWVGDIAKSHTKMLVKVAVREGLSGEDALDAVQEALHTFLSLPQARTLVDDPDDTAKLLTVVTRNVARNMRRRHFRSKAHGDVDNHELAADQESAQDLITKAEDHIKLLGCLDMLGRMQRNVVTLRMLEEASAAEVATALELTEQNVRVLLHRAKKSLRECMVH